MKRKVRWLAALLAAFAVASLGVVLSGSGGGTPAGAQTVAVNDDVQKLEAKLRAFTTVGGQPGDIRNRADLQRAIELEAEAIARKSSHPPEGGGGTTLEELERLNAKLRLFTSLGGDTATLQNARANLRRAIEDELRQLRLREEGKGP
jgi:multidrug efflux pump subunit AcrA (membrane-fusion protein)